MDAKLGCIIVNGEHGRLPTRYRHICRKLSQISPDCPLISDEEREAVFTRIEAALVDKSRVVRSVLLLHG
jgi:hypothetical protein